MRQTFYIFFVKKILKMRNKSTKSFLHTKVKENMNKGRNEGDAQITNTDVLL